MASSDDYLTEDVYFNGSFVPKPLMYFDSNTTTTICDVDLWVIDFLGFMNIYKKVTRVPCNDVYFGLPDKSLGEDIHGLHNYGDYKEFLDTDYNNEVEGNEDEDRN
ncbi:hypothetical protein LXL04_033629 [Taraxacum kok-saghyz]